MDRARRQRCVVALAAGLVAFAAIVSTSSASKRVPTGPWTGTFEQSSATVAIKLTDNPIRPLVVKFEEVSMQCSDGTTFPQDLTAKGKMRKDGSFRIEHQYPRSFGGVSQGYADTRGRLKGNQIRGTFYELRVSLRPDLVPSCATPYPLRWTATRVRR